MDIAALIEKLPESLTLGALAIECLKGRITDYANSKVSTGYKSIVGYIKSINTKEELPKNHHLLIALRTAMLKATGHMAAALTNEMSLAAVEKQEQQYVKEFKKKLLGWVDDELKNVGDWVQKGWFETTVADRVELILTERDNTDIKTLSTTLSQNAVNEWKSELRHGLGMDLPAIVNNYLDNGWNEDGKDMDWFNIVSYWFAQLLKDDSHARDAFQNRLLSEIAAEVGLVNEKLDILLAHFQSSIKHSEYIKERWDAIELQLVRIERGLDNANEKLDNIIEYFQKKVKELESEIKKYQTQTGSETDAVIVNHIRTLLEDKKRIEKALLEKDKLIERYEKEIEELKRDLKDDNEELKDRVVDALDEGKLDDAEALLLKSIGGYENAEEELKEKEAELKAKKAEGYYQLGKIKELKLEYRPALEYYEMAVKASPENTDYLHKAGTLSCNLGYVDNAINYLQRAVEALVKQNDSHPDLALLYNDIGMALSSKGKYDMAIEYYVRALDIDKQNHGEDYILSYVYYNNIGLVLHTCGTYDGALVYYYKALSILKQRYGESHPVIAVEYNNLGGVLSNMGEYDKAIDYYEKALVIDKQYYGESHPNIAIRYNNLGMTWNYKEEYNRAIDYLEQALIIDKLYYGESHPEIATRYNNLGIAWRSKGIYEKAIGYYELALAIDKEYYGESHPNIATRYNNLGWLFLSKGEYDKAIGYYEIALGMLLKFFNEGHPYITTVRKSLARCIAERDQNQTP